MFKYLKNLCVFFKRKDKKKGKKWKSGKVFFLNINRCCN